MELKDRYDELLIQNNKLQDEKTSLERTVGNLNEARSTQKTEINKLVEDNQKLIKLAQDNEKTIKSLESEKLKIISKNEELLFDLKNLNGKLKSKEENLLYTQRQLDESKAASLRFQNNLKDNDKQIENLRSEITHLNFALQSEKNTKLEADKQIEKFRNVIADREREISRYILELEDSRKSNKKSLDDKYILENENEKLKNHIFILTEQNQKVIFFKFFLMFFIYYHY